MLLVLARAVIFGSESRGARDHILLSQIRNFPFRRLLRLAGATVEVFDPASIRDLSLGLVWPPFITFREPCRNHRLEEFRYCCLRTRCHGNEYSFEAMVSFLSVYKFQSPYPRKPCSVSSWFPRINLSVATYLPIRFLETAHMSHYHSKLYAYGHRY
jgi:hypothetical protein